MAYAHVDLVEQDVAERTFSDWSLEEVAFAEPPTIGDIEQLRLFGDRIFVYDLADMNVKRYALSGVLEAVYGRGRGQGPGEFQNIFSFWARGEEVVWIVDSASRSVSRFRYDGSFADSFKPEFFPGRVATFDGDQLAILMYVQPELFALVNEDGEVQRRFGDMKGESLGVHTPMFDGHLFPRPDGGFVWAPKLASFLFFYGENAELERRIALIDGHTFPIDEATSNPAQFNASTIERPHRTLVVSFSNGAIFVNTLVRDNEGGHNVLDRYDRASGKYIDSVRMPRGGNQYQVHEGVIYGGRADTTLRAFRFNVQPL